MTDVSTPRPTEVRQLNTPAALALADLATIFEELQTVLMCCERMMTELSAAPGTNPGPRQPDALNLEALWTTALLSYCRCFQVGERGQGLTPEDVTATGLTGDLLGWHHTLHQLRKHYADPAANPRETFSVGAARDVNGVAGGVAVASARQPLIDQVTVQQTGAVAFELSRIVDERILAQQEVVSGSLESMSQDELDGSPLLALTEA